jgi:hypothetical protein
MAHQCCITYDAAMRTTVDLPAAAHRRARELATERGISLSSLIAELTIRGLSEVGTPAKLTQDRTTGLPVLHLGHPVTDDDVAAALADE